MACQQKSVPFNPGFHAHSGSRLVLGSMQVEIRVEVRRCDLSGEAREQGAVPGEPAQRVAPPQRGGFAE